MKPIKAFISTALFCAGGLMMLPQNMPPSIPNPPPIPRETVYGIPQGNWKTGIQLQETKCQQFLRNHHWTQSLLMMPVTNMASATNVNAATWYPVLYCTNCGVLRIEVK